MKDDFFIYYLLVYIEKKCEGLPLAVVALEGLFHTKIIRRLLEQVIKR